VELGGRHLTLKRLIVVVIVAWLLLVLVSFVFFDVGDSKPGDGRGDTIEQPASP
jgi:uncharacterized membrane protein YdfJ with MMPL/SSD domain